MAGNISPVSFVQSLVEQMQNGASAARSAQERIGALAPGGEKQASHSGGSFASELEKAIQGVNDKQKTADRMGMELSTGRNGNIHETMLAASQAELSFNLMVQLRNKGLEAYNEVMRMPV